MSNKSGTSGQIISTPQGGGALQGIGEKFSPDLHTGTGNFTVPIALPPGRNGFQPQLSLGYSTGNGNGAFGLGWGLSIPGVSRQTSKGIPRYDDLQDIFILSGAEDLVPINSDPNIKSYRPRTEGLFARIEHHRDANNDFWQVWSKDGLISFYGTPRPIEAASDWQDPAVVADPSKRDKIFAWKLSQTIDPFGNRIEYEYERDTGEEGAHRWDQIYLKRIRYVDYSDRGVTKFLISVTFEYEDRLDAFSEYRAGFEMCTRRRCQQIVVRTHTEVEQLVRTYQLIYLDRRNDLGNLGELLPLNGVSLLSQVKVTGHNGEAQESLPPLEFSYTRFELEERKFSPVLGKELPARSLANPELELADLFGNGLPDILEMNGTVRYWRNLGNGKFDRPREMRDAPAGLQLADPGVQMIDADSDGRIDLLVTTDTTAGYFPLRFGGLWDRKSFQRYEFAPSFNLEDPEVRLVDLDGDGVTDAIRSGSRMECFFNHPQRGWHETRFVERQALEVFPNVNFSDPRVKLGDMTGDGLQNIVLIHDGKIEYWPNLGYGNWGKQIVMTNSPRFPYGYDPKRILVGDIDGDGLDDIVYVDDRKVTLWINQCGNSWSNPIEIKGTPSISDIDAVRLVDLLGIGISGILWSMDANGISRSNLFFLDFTGGVKPYLLSETVSGAEEQRDRRGLTGSALLLQDIFQLDQYAFETNRRKLQLTQTFSLAQLAPIEFQRFREKGRLLFATPMELFDRDFPGHYLRLIKRVRVSVIALTPPTRGIRATLTASGLSRVVVSGDVFQPIVVRRDPEQIAFTSPSNATGLFELEPPGELLLPFESMGVDTTWELQMPKAANPFDFSTIADVLITIDYTALYSFDYRQQVIKSLNLDFSADRPISLRNQFPDQWYDLHNPNKTTTPLTVKFKTLREDFPPNLDDLSIEQVVMYFV
jgi:Salmonella virulence plasmid 65kDa B protein/Tc toxin complex TcA C-terminal TcB-binding domain/FG-GAP-like repeat